MVSPQHPLTFALFERAVDLHLEAVAYTHTCAAFAGAFLLRFARLFPYDMDALETIDMVDKLATLLSDGMFTWSSSVMNRV